MSVRFYLCPREVCVALIQSETDKTFTITHFPRFCSADMEDNLCIPIELNGIFLYHITSICLGAVSCQNIQNISPLESSNNDIYQHQTAIVDALLTLLVKNNLTYIGCMSSYNTPGVVIKPISYGRSNMYATISVYFASPTIRRNDWPIIGTFCRIHAAYWPHIDINAMIAMCQQNNYFMFRVLLNDMHWYESKSHHRSRSNHVTNWMHMSASLNPYNHKLLALH
jgi:hypothetical protein